VNQKIGLSQQSEMLFLRKKAMLLTHLSKDKMLYKRASYVQAPANRPRSPHPIIDWNRWQKVLYLISSLTSSFAVHHCEHPPQSQTNWHPVWEHFGMQYKLPAKGTCCSLGAQSPIHWHPSHQTVSSLCVLFFFPFSLLSLAHLCHLQNLMKNFLITGRNSAIKRCRKMGSNHLQIQKQA